MKTENKKIFISYSWSNPEHEQWVQNLAERLCDDGIDVILDKWDLKEGHDMYSFMESMVNDAEVDNVLVILDEQYSNKANSRKGGVGTETLIISPELYTNAVQQKFIPIVVDKDENNQAHMPTYMKGRIYIDFSPKNNYEAKYEELLRVIYKRPISQKPKIGNPPSYLFEDSPMSSKTNNILRSLENEKNQQGGRLKSLTKEMFTTFLNDLEMFKLTDLGRQDVKQFGNDICDNLVSYLPLRNNLILFVDTLLKFEYQYDYSLITDFLEKLHDFKDRTESSYSWDNDNFKFIIHEIIISFIALCLKYKNYDLLEYLLHKSYYITARDYRNKELGRFELYYFHISSIDSHYKEVYSKNFMSPQADLLIKRVHEDIGKNLFIQADLLLYYIAELEGIHWFPLTYIYAKDDKKLEIFKKMPSIEHWQKVKGIFGVQDSQELKSKLNVYKENKTQESHRGFPGSFGFVIPLHRAVDIEKLATIR